jgi:hypothetical protein
MWVVSIVLIRVSQVRGPLTKAVLSDADYRYCAAMQPMIVTQYLTSYVLVTSRREA